jgi:hypothetical protein
MPAAPGRGCGVFFGSLRAISTNSSLTLVAVFALVSMKKMPLSLAYDSASCEVKGQTAGRSEVEDPACSIDREGVYVAAPSKRTHLWFHLALRAQVRLVAGQRNYNVGITLPLQLLNPLLRALERVLWQAMA